MHSKITPGTPPSAAQARVVMLTGSRMDVNLSMSSAANSPATPISMERNTVPGLHFLTVQTSRISPAVNRIAAVRFIVSPIHTYERLMKNMKFDAVIR